jgi:allophanate hydrolase
MRADGIPFGVTLLAPGGRDAELASLGRVYQANARLTLGGKGLTQPPLAALPAIRAEEIAIAVVGAHLSGMALNGELLALGGRLLKATATAPDYRLFALKGTSPPKPGMLRVAPGAGSAIEVEVWALSPAAFGSFVAAIPSPLSIGTLRLADGFGVKGFLVEAAAVDGARDISAFGGWRAFMADAVATV